MKLPNISSKLALQAWIVAFATVILVTVSQVVACGTGYGSFSQFKDEAMQCLKNAPEYAAQVIECGTDDVECYKRRSGAVLFSYLGCLWRLHAEQHCAGEDGGCPFHPNPPPTETPPMPRTQRTQGI
jgi:hypothetical protein